MSRRTVTAGTVMPRPRTARTMPRALLAFALAAMAFTAGCAGCCGLSGGPAAVVVMTEANMGKEVFVHGRLCRFMHMTDHTFFELLWALEGGPVLLPQAKVEPLAAEGRRVDVRGQLVYVPGGRGVEGGSSPPYWALDVQEIARCRNPLHRSTEFRPGP